jgi:hypothetical protein
MKINSKVLAWAVVLTVWAGSFMISSYMIGWAVGHRDRPAPAVCHSPSEDSTPTDCDYVHGEWRPRRGATGTPVWFPCLGWCP